MIAQRFLLEEAFHRESPSKVYSVAISPVAREGLASRFAVELLVDPGASAVCALIHEQASRLCARTRSIGSAESYALREKQAPSITGNIETWHQGVEPLFSIA